jgi:hypothetical protein
VALALVYGWIAWLSGWTGRTDKCGQARIAIARRLEPWSHGGVTATAFEYGQAFAGATVSIANDVLPPGLTLTVGLGDFPN